MYPCTGVLGFEKSKTFSYNVTSSRADVYLPILSGGVGIYFPIDVCELYVLATMLPSGDRMCFG
jgi:hypothetical protein